MFAVYHLTKDLFVDLVHYSKELIVILHILCVLF